MVRFSMQTTLLAGFVLNALTLNAFYQYQGHEIACYIYWIFSSVLFAASIHCLVTAVYCNVYGSGLAMRGPLG